MLSPRSPVCQGRLGATAPDRQRALSRRPEDHAFQHMALPSIERYHPPARRPEAMARCAPSGLGMLALGCRTGSGVARRDAQMVSRRAKSPNRVGHPGEGDGAPEQALGNCRRSGLKVGLLAQNRHGAEGWRMTGHDPNETSSGAKPSALAPIDQRPKTH
jgi:hypothetical protein